MLKFLKIFTKQIPPEQQIELGQVNQSDKNKRSAYAELGLLKRTFKCWNIKT